MDIQKAGSPEIRQEKIASIRDRLEKARADAEKRAAAYDKEKKKRAANRETVRSR